MLACALTVFVHLLTAASPAPTVANRVAGDYVEARTADVYTGPCFSNAEVFITGHQAVLAWKVTEGSWKGVELNGLSVAAAVLGTTTFSLDDAQAAKSVLIVDEKASPSQREALIEMAKALGGDRLKNVVAVRTSTLTLNVEDRSASSEGEHASHKDHGMPLAPMAQFSAPGLAEILTRPLGADDHVCGNETIAYEPLSSGVHALPAYTLRHKYAGKELNTRWNDPNCRSSFVGHFSR
jgi:hypothetical protein